MSDVGVGDGSGDVDDEDDDDDDDGSTCFSDADAVFSGVTTESVAA